MLLLVIRFRWDVKFFPKKYLPLQKKLVLTKISKICFFLKQKML
jgi:hypothetical protein